MDEILRQLAELTKKVDTLLKWKTEREKQQITQPLDPESKRILEKDFIRVIGKGFFTRASGIIGDYFWYVRNNDYIDRIGLYGPMVPINVDLATNTFTVPNHGYVDTQVVQFLNISPDGVIYSAPPAPLIVNSPYSIINATANTFQLETFAGSGIVLDITDQGTGSTYVSTY